MSRAKLSQPSLTSSQVSAFRLRRHHLLDTRPAALTQLARDTCGVQAQFMWAAEMALWARAHRLTRAQIQAALWKRRNLVKTSCMRGTLHLLAAADFPVYMSAFRSSRVRASLRIMARYGVTEKEAYAVMEAAVAALSRGPVARRELTKRVLSQVKVSKKARLWFEQSSWGVIRHAMFEGLVCYGPDREQEVTVVRVDQWLPRQREVPEVEAQQILLRRYLSAYGPATPQDFCKWSGFPMKEAGSIWKSIGDELAEVSAGGRRGFLLRKDCGELARTQPAAGTVRLLPNFDPYLLGHADKSALVDARHYKRVFRKAGWISSVVLLDGRVIGTWSFTRQRKKASLEVVPFESFSKAVRASIEAEAASLGAFLQTSWEIRFDR